MEKVQKPINIVHRCQNLLEFKIILTFTVFEISQIKKKLVYMCIYSGF
jgi:hypothetical protein